MIKKCYFCLVMAVIDFLASFLALVGFVLSIKQKPIFWIFYILASAIFVYLFYSLGLWAMAFLAFVNIFIDIFGFYSWLTKKTNEGKIFKITRNQLKQYFFLWFLTFLLTLLILSLAESSNKYLDSFLFTNGVLATWLVAKKIYENWYLWIVTDAVSLIFYLNHQRYFLAILNLVYVVNCFWGLKEWKKNLVEAK